MARMYGSVCNRIGEGKNYVDGELKVGVDITMYYWSDRICYYITKVVDQKHIFVREYEVVADHEKPGGMGHQNWLYFKTRKEANEYLNQYLTEDYIKTYGYNETENVREPREREWVFRYGKWVEKIGDKEYRKLSGKISFGVKDYYYDWEF